MKKKSVTSIESYDVARAMELIGDTLEKHNVPLGTGLCACLALISYYREQGIAVNMVPQNEAPRDL